MEEIKVQKKNRDLQQGQDKVVTAFQVIEGTWEKKINQTERKTQAWEGQVALCWQSAALMATALHSVGPYLELFSQEALGPKAFELG